MTIPIVSLMASVTAVSWNKTADLITGMYD